MNDDIARVCLDNAPGNSKYTSPDIQKEILQILANEVRKKVREEIGSAKFCIIVNEALDESNQEQMVVILSSALDPTNHFESFNIDDICTLAKKFYLGDFTERELSDLKRQLQHFKNDVLVHPKFQNISSLSELCRGFVETRNSHLFFLIERLIRLVLTLLVSTASIEHAFSAMKLVMTPLHNKMNDDFSCELFGYLH
ncbi:hypothetical protein Ddye_017528 [Dipteronia dyeriana]|uniref:HAT C-terminal dimerisation domain-containing protein n=1 Tax=Dipteronia dyeriana TaxID=168575 RepID=A0AAD9WZV8_9ROSI|nr:hypothetical protein Ddye_017528 [Dipteronia dyeriana]